MININSGTRFDFPSHQPEQIWRNNSIPINGIDHLIITSPFLGEHAHVVLTTDDYVRHLSIQRGAVKTNERSSVSRTATPFVFIDLDSCQVCL